MHFVVIMDARQKIRNSMYSIVQSRRSSHGSEEKRKSGSSTDYKPAVAIDVGARRLQFATDTAAGHVFACLEEPYTSLTARLFGNINISFNL